MLPQVQKVLQNLCVDKFFKKGPLDFFYFICHIYLPFMRKQMVLLYFGRDVRTCLGVAISEVSEPPVYHIKVERPINHLTEDDVYIRKAYFKTYHTKFYY